MAPPKWRGAFTTAFQSFLSGGVLFATIINWFASKMGENGGRFSLGCGGIPAIIMTVGAFFIPDTPSSLIQRGQLQKARQSLDQVRGVDSDTEVELNNLINYHEAAKAATKQPYKTIFQRKYRPHLVMTAAIPVVDRDQHCGLLCACFVSFYWIKFEWFFDWSYYTWLHLFFVYICFSLFC